MKVCTVDIGHAYLNAERTEADGEDIVMEIEPFLVLVLQKVAPEVYPIRRQVDWQAVLQVE